MEEKSASMMAKLPRLSDVDITKVAKLTAQQSNSRLWGRIRKGRLTASNFGRVSSRFRTLDNPADARKDTRPILCELMGYSTTPNMPQLQHGKDGEKAARPLYLTYLTEKGHVNAQLTLTGLHIDKQYVFLGASPDLLISCDCCKPGLAEIKCPFIAHPDQLKEQACLDENLSLKRNHKYFFQIQGQMGITNRCWCDFVMCVGDKVFVERIDFDEKVWNDLQKSLVQFFRRLLLPEIISNENRPQNQVRETRKNFSKESVQKRKRAEEEEAAMSVLNVETSVDVLMEDMDIHEGDTSYCPICKLLCKDIVKSFQNNSVQCESCFYWFHMKCLKMTRKKFRAFDDKPYQCSECLRSKVANSSVAVSDVSAGVLQC